nr:ankyrin repeat protein [Oriental turtle dovepox virus]
MVGSVGYTLLIYKILSDAVSIIDENDYRLLHSTIIHKNKNGRVNMLTRD